MKKIIKKQNFGKKGITQYLITIVLSVVIFFILLQYFIGNSEFVTSEADDLACRTWVSTLGSLGEGLKMPIGEALKQLNYKCKKENVLIRSTQRDDIYQDIADRVNKCWYRFGEGEYRFMSYLDTQGEWCFTCAKLSFREKGEIFEYYGKDGNSYIEWAAENYITLSNGSRIPHLDYASYRFVELSHDELLENHNELKGLASMSEDFDGFSKKDFEELIDALVYQNLELIDLASKKIDTSSDLYVVYRYDVVEKDTIDNLIDSLGTSVAVGTVTTVGVGLAGSLIAGATVGIVCPPCGLGVFTASALKKAHALKTATSTAIQVQRATTLIHKITTAIKVTGRMHPVASLSGVAAGSVAATFSYHYNDNHVQYVDLLTKEQYYRSCGTEPVGFDRGFFN